MKRYLSTLAMLAASCCACSDDGGANAAPDAADAFGIDLQVEVSASTATVEAVPTDREALYTLYVIEADAYDPTNTPAGALDLKGPSTHTFEGLAPATDYLAVADAPLEGHKATKPFRTGAFPAEEGSGESDGYRLLWEDRFNGEAPDPAVWNFEINGNGNGNAELQYYRAENVSIAEEPASGRRCLRITARRESYGGRSFTSGRINTRDKKCFTHGKVEALIRLPHTADGLWPAFWMMGNDITEVGWPKCGEIDILEMGNAQGIRSGTQDRLFNGACHWGFYKDGAYPNYARSTTAPASLQDDFHLFTLVWDADMIRMYLDLDRNPDAEPYFEMGISSMDGEWATGLYFHKESFILFNLAVGGYFTGILDPAGITALASEGDEASMWIDYVRVYQKQPNP